MSKKYSALKGAVAMCAAGILGMTAATGAPGWSYEGETGPENWNEMFETCAAGTEQSPINIELANAYRKSLRNPIFNYDEAGKAFVFNNGHSVELEPVLEESNSVILDGEKFYLLQAHFHAPAEHLINGKRYAAEVHFVHQAEDGHLAVIGVFLKRGKFNVAWRPFTKVVPSATALAEDTEIEIDLESLMPSNLQTARYDGSLTTPPCTEGVSWNVLVNPVELSPLQIEQFTRTYYRTFRPVQPLNNRTVVFDIRSKA